MGFFYSDKNGNRVFSFKVTFKFGKGSPADEKSEKVANTVLTILEKLGIKVSGPFDNDPNKDKRLLK